MNMFNWESQTNTKKDINLSHINVEILVYTSCKSVNFGCVFVLVCDTQKKYDKQFNNTQQDPQINWASVSDGKESKFIAKELVIFSSYLLETSRSPLNCATFKTNLHSLRLSVIAKSIFFDIFFVRNKNRQVVLRKISVRSCGI